MTELELVTFTITEDHCKAKGNEGKIKFLINGAMEAIQATANKLIQNFNITLPNLKTVDYEIAFDY